MRAARRTVIALAAVVTCATTAGLEAQESATVTVPMAVSFNVTDIGAAAGGAPPSTRVEFTNAALLPDRAVRISVRAETDTFGAGTNTFEASLVSWNVAGATNGAGTNGTLSATSWTPVFQGTVNATEGGADLSWTLAAPGRTHAGTHTLNLQWKIESVAP